MVRKTELKSIIILNSFVFHLYWFN